MDPITTPVVAAILVKIFDDAAGKAGKQAWTALTGLVRRAFGGRDKSRPVQAVTELERHPGDPARVEELAGALAAAADLDPEFAADLRRWLADAEQVSGGVTNIVGGSAQVHGNLVQARDIHGSITFGDANRR
ncbi:MAG TPA: hypothetical protein VFU43_30885 [Streptosporangiaceae bacterium]|nr:hypothetical protein [Streptosporangiaceae bacterium]